MRTSNPTTLTLPPFQGAVKRILTIAIVAFIALLLLGRTPWGAQLAAWTILEPALLLRAPWTLLSYSFVPLGVLSSLFALLSVWFFGSAMEAELGERWLLEYFFVTTIGGGLLASALCFAHIPGLPPDAQTAGLWPFVLALLLAFARLHPEQELRFNFILTLKAKYLAAIYLLIYLASALLGGDRFGAATALCAALSGFAYLRFVPRRGLGFAASERWFALRNSFYRNKRKQAARKFTVYMKQQGKDVHFDASGKYVALDELDRKDPNDKRWMN